MNDAQDGLEVRFAGVSMKSGMEVLVRFAALWGNVGRYLLNKKHDDYVDHETLVRIFEIYDHPENESAASGELSSTAETKKEIAADWGKRQIVKFENGKMVDEQALARDAGLTECVHIKTTMRELKMMRESKQPCFAPISRGWVFVLCNRLIN